VEKLSETEDVFHVNISLNAGLFVSNRDFLTHERRIGECGDEVAVHMCVHVDVDVSVNDE
jgi:hypothetical protein